MTAFQPCLRAFLTAIRFSSAQIDDDPRNEQDKNKRADSNDLEIDLMNSIQVMDPPILISLFLSNRFI
jgi:hypothetical protein